MYCRWFITPERDQIASNERDDERGAVELWVDGMSTAKRLNTTAETKTQTAQMEIEQGKMVRVRKNFRFLPYYPLE